MVGTALHATKKCAQAVQARNLCAVVTEPAWGVFAIVKRSMMAQGAASINAPTRENMSMGPASVLTNSGDQHAKTECAKLPSTYARLRMKLDTRFCVITMANAVLEVCARGVTRVTEVPVAA